jgi:hypothetical protein
MGNGIELRSISFSIGILTRKAPNAKQKKIMKLMKSFLVMRTS